MESTVAVQMKGLGFVFQAARYSSMAATRPSTLAKTPRDAGIEVGENRLRKALRSAKEFGSDEEKVGRTNKLVYFLNDPAPTNT
jgi:hypothetical protein